MDEISLLSFPPNFKQTCFSCCLHGSRNSHLHRPMAVSFKDLHAESIHKSLKDFLTRKTYVCGDNLTKDDIKVYAVFSGKPDDPNASRWHNCVSSHLAASFPGIAIGISIGGSAATASVEAAALAGAAEVDDDDLDLLGDETEEEKKAAEEREAFVEGSAKMMESGKSSVLLDVKPWDDLVCVDSLIEEHLTVERASEYIQSWDIVAFNKI